VDDPAVSAVVDRLCQPSPTPPPRRPGRGAAARLAGCLVAGPPQDAAPVPDELRPAIAAMQGEAGQRLTVQALAQACGMSAPRFIRRFQAVFGLTPGSYLQNQRLNGARRLLAQGSALADTAQAMGFADQAHLQRSFKAHHAMTPGDYRPPRR
jgi:transcriptional regulator GlxA family with amidase domain